VILVDAYPRHAWLLAAVAKRLREELADLQIEISPDGSDTTPPTMPASIWPRVVED
jgi:RNA-directed DNA polymerase